jgi:hypothetical protein
VNVLKVLLLCLVLGPTISGAAENKDYLNLDINFAAPVVNDKANYTNSVVFGTILFDDASGSFVGLDNTGSWVTLGTSPSTARSVVSVYTTNGYGSTTNNKIRRYSNIRTNTGSAITYTDSASDGASFTINSNGIYAISYTEVYSGGDSFGITLNESSLTTTINSVSASERLGMGFVNGSGEPEILCWVGHLSASDEIRPHTTGVGAAGTDKGYFTITKIND